MMTSNDNAFLEILRTTFPEMYLINDLITRGELTMEEVTEVIHKLAIVRTSDDGFGKILIEMQRKPEGNWTRIRTIQDKVLRTLPEEDFI